MYDYRQSRRDQVKGLEIQLSVLSQAIALVDSDDPDYQAFLKVVRGARKRIVDTIAKIED